MRLVCCITLSLVVGLIALATPQPTVAPPATQPLNVGECDVVIRGGRIIDGAGNAWFFGDLAIDAGRIIAVGNVGALRGRAEIDAKGLVVAPGFIDVHTHADDDLYKLPQAENFIRDGVTTIVTGNCGYGVKDVAEYFTKLKEKG